MYTFTGNNIIRQEDGAVIPLHPSNSDYLSALEYLLKQGLVEVDENNNIIVKPVVPPVTPIKKSKVKKT